MDPVWSTLTFIRTDPVAATVLAWRDEQVAASLARARGGGPTPAAVPAPRLAVAIRSSYAA